MKHQHFYLSFQNGTVCYLIDGQRWINKCVKCLKDQQRRSRHFSVKGERERSLGPLNLPSARLLGSAFIRKVLLQFGVFYVVALTSDPIAQWRSPFTNPHMPDNT